jgi:hypothetical protein
MSYIREREVKIQGCEAGAGAAFELQLDGLGAGTREVHKPEARKPGSQKPEAQADDGMQSYDVCGMHQLAGLRSFNLPPLPTAPTTKIIR